MAKVLQSNGDLILKTRSLNQNDPARIILDPGGVENEVYINAKLIVEGETITVATENLTIEDNFIVINIGETGAGVTLQNAGFQVDRGTLPPASLIWDEAVQAWGFVTGEEGSFVYQDNNVVLRNVLTRSSVDSGNLTLIGAGSGVISVAGTVDYELNVVDDDHIPNKKYVDTQIVSAPGHSIKADNTGVFAADADIADGEPGSVSAFTSETSQYTEGDASAVSIIVDDNLNTQFYADKVVTQNLEIRRDSSYDAILANKNEGSNLYFKTETTGKLQTNYALQLDKHASVPASVSGSTLIYADDPGLGATGIYYVNDGNIVEARNDELISRRKALVYSMIF